jgi:hypothetical protein
MTGIEALADAIMNFEGWHAGSRSNRNRNPGNLRDSAAKVAEDPDGYAVFPDLPTGYRALLDDITAKVTGHNTHGLGPASTLADFFRIYAPSGDRNDPDTYARHVASELTLALRKPVYLSTTLGSICPEAQA